MSALVRRLVRNFGLVAVFLGAALLGTASGVIFAFAGDLPKISALDDYSPPTTTRVLGRDGSVIGEFATERRQLVTYDQIPPVVRNAIVSAEDASFFTHSGLSVPHILTAAVRDVIHRRYAYGASTITNQLAKKLFLTDDKSPERKIKEELLTIQIEKRYTKQEIFTMYCNKIYWGHGAYGVEAASELYFAKHIWEVNLDEAAMIAGIIQGNQRQSPYVDMKAAVYRRNYTLDRMAANGYITQADADAAKKRPIVTRGQPTPPRSIAPYFVENIRIQLEDRYGTKAVQEGGLIVRTGLDPQLQQASNRALDAGLRRLDKLRGYRKPATNLLAQGKTIESFRSSRLAHDPGAGDIIPAVVTAVEGGVVRVAAARWQGTIDRAGYEWTGRKADAILRRGDVIEVKVGKVDPKGPTFTASLDQTPELEGAVLAIDNHTGAILAMVGGRSFDHSQFNRATQALRQVGSLFKPFVYTAAIDRGYTATSPLHDEPASYDVGPGQPPYQPRNFDRAYQGDVTLRWALEDSRNVPTVALMNELDPRTVIPYAQRMGITAPIQPYLSTAIGTSDVSLLEMTSAYTSWPNQGVRFTPMTVLEVTDRDGNVLEENRPEAHEVLRADTAFIITNLLEGVITHGTGAGKASLIHMPWPLGGKTGTTDDATDAWFIGFDPDITIGVWIGFDQKKSIGPNMQGADAALPVWIDIMNPWIDRRRATLPEPPAFEQPGNIVWVDGPNGPEAYIAGTEPPIKLPALRKVATRH